LVRRLHALAAVLLVGLAVGCTASLTHTVDHVQVEQLITSSQRAKAGSLSVSNATCPTNAPARVGTHFNCTVVVDGVIVVYAVAVDQVGGGKVHFTTQPSTPIVDTGKIVDALKQRVPKNVTVDCGRRIQQLAVGAIIRCTATDGTNAAEVSYSVGPDGVVTPVNPPGTSTTTGG
jgi:hypothetical protein